MIDQKIILVDSRGITHELAMRLFGQEYTRELALIGRFFDENGSEINNLITQYYVAELSGGHDVTVKQIYILVHTLVTRSMCRYFPNITQPQMESAKSLILATLEKGFHDRVREDNGPWDRCVPKELSQDTYAVICTRQISQPVSQQNSRGIFQYPINFPRPTTVSM